MAAAVPDPRPRRGDDGGERAGRVRGDAAAGFVLALVLAIVGALLLVHWMTCSQEAAVCAGAVIIVTRKWVRQP